MRRLIRALPWLLAAAAVAAPPPLDEPPAARLQLVAAEDGGPLPVPFFLHAGDVEIEGCVEFVPEGEMVRLTGVYTTGRVLDPEARLSYQIHREDGRLLVQDGTRFDWRPSEVPGERVATFEIEQSLRGLAGLHPTLRLQFNYVVEHAYWYRDRHPEVPLPQLEIRGPARAAFFRVLGAWIPPLWPAGAEGLLPVLIHAEVSPAQGFKPALDAVSVDGRERHEAPRGRAPTERSATKLLWYRVGEHLAGEEVLVRPGFVWDGVAWYDWLDENPYRKVRLVGPFGYTLALTALLAGLVLGGRWLRGPRGRVARAAGWAGWWLVAVLVAAGAGFNGYGVLAGAALVAGWRCRSIVPPGPRVYWITWAYGGLVEFYWAHVQAATAAAWTGTLLSLCLLAVLLLPLRLLRRPIAAALAGTVVVVGGALISTALAVYCDFFRDYPGLRDLLYVDQIGAVSDSLVVLVGQRHLVPWWLAVFACLLLWRSGRIGRRRPPAPMVAREVSAAVTGA